jgi:hypothetical protein
VDPLQGFIDCTKMAASGPARLIMVELIRSDQDNGAVAAHLAKRAGIDAGELTVVGVYSGAGLKTGYKDIKYSTPVGVGTTILRLMGGRLNRFDDDLISVTDA